MNFHLLGLYAFNTLSRGIDWRTKLRKEMNAISIIEQRAKKV